MAKQSPSQKRGRWWMVSLRVIDDVLQTCELGRIDDPDDIIRMVRDAYPFGVRENWPYQEWCRAVRYRIAPLGLAEPLPEPTVDHREELIAAGQLEMSLT